MRDHSAAVRTRFWVAGMAPGPAGRPLQALSSALLLTLLGAIWITCGPIQFGGQAAYVIVNGISMEPSFHRGDLVILRQADDYQVGDVVTYRHPRIGPIIHRIVALDGERYIFKGDNNSWIDGYHPTKAECIGKLWLHLPAAGNFIEQLRIPHNMAILAAILGLIVMSSITSSADQRKYPTTRRRAGLTIRFVVAGRATQRTAHQNNRPAQQRRAISLAGGSRDMLIFALTALACASLLLAIFAFTRATTRAVPDDISYEQTGTFSYSADAPDGVYETGSAQTGEPVFRQLSGTVAVQFVYRLATDQPADLRGSSRLAAEISDGSGWKRAIELQANTDFSGSTFNASGKLDFARIQALIDRYEQQAEIQRQQYTLAVVAHVSLAGTLDGQELRDEFAPRLEFLFDRQQLQVAQSSGGTNSPFTQSQQGMLKRSSQRPSTLALLGLALEVASARRIALTGLCLAVSGAFMLGFLLRRAAQIDEPTRIQQLYGRLLIALHDSEPGAGSPLVDVATIDDLVKLAEQHGVMIMHARHGAEQRYFVYDGTLTYRYRVAGLGAPSASLEPGVP
jgi:signal peptidase I